MDCYKIFFTIFWKFKWRIGYGKYSSLSKINRQRRKWWALAKSLVKCIACITCHDFTALTTPLKPYIYRVLYGLFHITSHINLRRPYQPENISLRAWYWSTVDMGCDMKKSISYCVYTIILITYMYIQKIMLHVHISLYSMYVYVQFYSANFNFPVKKRWNHMYIIKCKSCCLYLYRNNDWFTELFHDAE
jgi:hypothetical protein